jgi:hypothetical protein
MNKTFKFCCYAAAMMLAAGCDKSEQEYNPDINFSKTGHVTLVASIENGVTRASLANTGEARWKREDAISVICTDGTAVAFALDGTGETRKAFFSGTIPTGKEMGSYALYPVSTTLSGSTISIELPEEITPSSTGNCSVMAAEIKDSYEITFKHLLSYITVQIDNVSSEAVKIELKADKRLSGVFSTTFPGAFETGIVAQTGSNFLVINLLENKESAVTLAFAVPVGEYGSLVAAEYDVKDRKIGEVECLTAPMTTELAGLRSISATLPKAQMPSIEGAVLVADIYWALGNLQHVTGSTDEGFQTDWRIAPEQWEYVNCENAKASGSAVTFSPTDYTKCDHFNWGGVLSPYDNATSSSAVAPVGTDISGKMYTSQDCSVATTDFAQAKFGDLAYWASKGKFRMPTPAELQKLMEKASRQYGSYKIAEGKIVTGFLFTDPEEGESPVISDIEQEFTADDIAKGLFLPKGGRRYNTQAFTVNVQGTQGTYWASESSTGSGATQPCYGTVFHILSAGITFPYWNAAFDAKAGFMIRPVYIEKE